MKQPKATEVVPIPAMTVYQNRYAHLQDLISRHGGQSAVAEKLGGQPAATQPHRRQNAHPKHR